MGALKSPCKALEHLRMAFWSLCRWNDMFRYIILSEAGAHRVDFGASKAPAAQCDLRVRSVKRGREWQELLILL